MKSSVNISRDEALTKADGSMYTDHRKNSLGHKLMAAIHGYGRKSGCAMATTVATMSFHLPALCELRQTRGATVDFACPAVALQERKRKRTGYTQNSSCIFLKRSL